MCSCKIQNVRAQKKCSLSDILRVREDSVVIVMGTRKNRVLEEVFFAYTVYCTSKQGLRVCYPGCSLLQNKAVCFVVITDGFQKINPHLEAKQATTVFTLRAKRKKAHETS